MMVRCSKVLAVALGIAAFGAASALAAEVASPDAAAQPAAGTMQIEVLSSDAPADPEMVVAVVGKQEIKEKDIDALLARLDPQRAAFFATAEGRKRILEQVVSQKLFVLWGKESGLEKEEDFVKELNAMTENLVSQYALGKLLKSVAVSDEEIAAYYEQHKDQFTMPEQVHAFHILVASEDQAKQIKAEIEGGLSFDVAAQKYSSCPSKEQGGDLGFFGKGQMVPEFEKAAFELQLNTLSDPVKTDYGYHIIKVVEKKAAEVQPLDAVKDQVRELLLRDKQKQAYEAKIEELKKQFGVTYNQ